MPIGNGYFGSQVGSSNHDHQPGATLSVVMRKRHGHPDVADYKQIFDSTERSTELTPKSRRTSGKVSPINRVIG